MFNYFKSPYYPSELVPGGDSSFGSKQPPGNSWPDDGEGNTCPSANRGTRHLGHHSKLMKEIRVHLPKKELDILVSPPTWWRKYVSICQQRNSTSWSALQLDEGNTCPSANRGTRHLGHPSKLMKEICVHLLTEEHDILVTPPSWWRKYVSICQQRNSTSWSPLKVDEGNKCPPAYKGYWSARQPKEEKNVLSANRGPGPLCQPFIFYGTEW